MLVGVSEYESWDDLENIPDELCQFRHALEKLGFVVRTQLNPTEEELIEGVDDFIDSYGYERNHRLLFLFAGHGYTRRIDGIDHGYFVPSDAALPDMEPPVRFLRSAIPMTQIKEWARRIEVKHALFLFDSCFSGTILNNRSAGAPLEINKLTDRKARIYLTAGRALEQVPDRSRFVPGIVEALRGSGDLTGDGFITTSELLVYLRKEVASSGTSPQLGHFGEGDFVFETGRRASVVEETHLLVVEAGAEIRACPSSKGRILAEASFGDEYQQQGIQQEGWRSYHLAVPSTPKGRARETMGWIATDYLLVDGRARVSRSINRGLVGGCGQVDPSGEGWSPAFDVPIFSNEEASSSDSKTGDVRGLVYVLDSRKNAHGNDSFLVGLEPFIAPGRSDSLLGWVPGSCLLVWNNREIPSILGRFGGDNVGLRIELAEDFPWIFSSRDHILRFWMLEQAGAHGPPDGLIVPPTEARDLSLTLLGAETVDAPSYGRFLEIEWVKGESRGTGWVPERDPSGNLAVRPMLLTDRATVEQLLGLFGDLVEGGRPSSFRKRCLRWRKIFDDLEPGEFDSAAPIAVHLERLSGLPVRATLLQKGFNEICRSDSRSMSELQHLLLVGQYKLRALLRERQISIGTVFWSQGGYEISIRDVGPRKVWWKDEFDREYGWISVNDLP